MIMTVDSQKHWGKQTEMSLHHFRIGNHRFELSFIKALVSIKRSCAEVNNAKKLLDDDLSSAIIASCDDILKGDFDDQFPLSVWQTGSGTQTNMNVNEVISSLANEKLDGNQGEQTVVHPNDHVNMSQSSNDVFPSAMHVAVALATHEKMLKSLAQLDKGLAEKQGEFNEVFMVGRTHLMDAVPLSVGSVMSAFRAQLKEAKQALLDSLTGVYRLAIGGTAVGSGCNAPWEFGELVAENLVADFGLPFKVNRNLYAAVSGQDSLLRYSGVLKQLASVLLKMANDFRLLGSGPRCGFNEWLLPANEPGSSIMPGKVNPTQCEALSMVCLQVFGNDLTVSLAASSGQLQLNVYRPVIIHNILESVDLLAGAMRSFDEHCVRGLALNESQIKHNMNRNLSSITVLAPKLGYDVAAKIVHEARTSNSSLTEAAERLGLFERSKFEAMLQKLMTEHDHTSDNGVSSDL